MGRGRGRAAVPAARVPRHARARRRHPRLPARGRRPRHRPACAELRAGDGLWLLGPLGNGFAPPRDGRRPVLVGGGVGIAPLAIWSDALGGAETLLGFRDAAHAEGAALIPGARVATDDGSVGHHGLVTDLLPRDARHRGLRLRAAARCSTRSPRSATSATSRPSSRWSRAWRAGSAPASAASSRRKDGYVRLCVDGPVLEAADAVIEFCGIPLAHRIINGSGTFDAIAARRAFGDALLEQFPFAAFVSKTVTLEPRQGNPPPRLWELPGGMINSIGLPNKGLEGYLEHDLPQLAELPVPLIVNVMGSTREDVARLVSAFAERDEVAALELNVSCPNVKTGLIMGADPSELAGAARRGASADRQAADRQAHAELRVAGRRRRRGRGARRRRRLADQHAARHGDRPAPPGRAVARRRHRRRVRAGRPRDRAELRSARSAQRVALPIIGMGGVQSGRHAQRPQRRWRGSRRCWYGIVPRPARRRRNRRTKRPSRTKLSLQTAARRDGGRARVSTKCRQKPCKVAGYRQLPCMRLDLKLRSRRIRHPRLVERKEQM